MKSTLVILETLQLQNFATFKNHVVNFGPGLNAIIGETGSGKSLLLEALQLVFGGRADKKAVRLGCDSAVVEAMLSFEDAQIGKELEEMGFPADGGEIVIKRIVKKDGTSKCWLNHMACNLSQIIYFSRRYVDLVGQFENQKLLSDGYQLRLLDQFGQTTTLADETLDAIRVWRDLHAERDQLERSQADREQKLDYLEFQLQEIDTLAPRSGEEDILIQAKNDFLNFEKKQLIQHQLDELIEGGEQNQGLEQIIRSLKALIHKNPSIVAAAVAEKLSLMEDSFVEFQETLKSGNSQEIDEEAYQAVLEKLDGYQKLKRKFGGSVESILEARHQFALEAEGLRSLETNLNDIQQKLSTAEQVAQRLATDLHGKRLENAPRFAKAITKAVNELRMEGAEIRIDLEKLPELTDHGFTRLQFLAQTNKGEGFFRVKEIASGGELSRILLALRQILSSHDSISIFLFDEIDTGMGGETALHIGKSLKKVSENSQVITITHLPQIASFADKLIVVSKETKVQGKDERTESLVRELSATKDIKKEISGMTPLH